MKTLIPSSLNIPRFMPSDDLDSTDMNSPKKKPKPRVKKPQTAEKPSSLIPNFRPLTGELLKYAQEMDKMDAEERAEPPMTDDEFWEQVKRNRAILKARKEPLE